MADIYAITNAGFEQAATGWTLGPSASVVTYSNPPEGTHAVQFDGTSGMMEIVHDPVPCLTPNKKITASAMYQQGAAVSGRNPGAVALYWYNSVGDKIGETVGTYISSGSGGQWKKTSVVGDAPVGTASVSVAMKVNRDSTAPSWADSFQWDHKFTGAATLTYPTNGSTYSEGQSVPFRVSVTDSGTVTVASVTYKTATATLGTSTATPFGINVDTLTAGTYDVRAEVTYSDGTVVTTNTNLLNISALPPVEPITREFKASNSYTNLVLGNFKGLAAAMPSVATVTGAELLVDYRIDIVVRTKDVDVAQDQSNLAVPFDITEGATFEVMLLEGEGEYSQVGGTTSVAVPVDAGSFNVTETGLSGEYRYRTYSMPSSTQVVIGSDLTALGAPAMAASDFLRKHVGIKFFPALTSVPAYTSSGDCVFRVKIDKVAVRAYFDAGSVDYYFVSPTGDVIKGTAVATNVLSGDLKLGDASGVMQLSATLDTTGSDPYNEILEGWTIHTGLPHSADNQIGVVAADMKYNGMPNAAIVQNAGTRVEMITANFYGDERLKSVYGVNGVDRAFSFNKSEFYKIYTQEDPSKDMPRHLAYHHAHLALGYGEGRVDVSVVGEPYNFSGVMGASSWGTGDNVTGLLPLSGTLLGVFGSSSVTGLSGTTVDNFATQTISAKMGAVEYTIADMGFPVYANAYGLYTLNQVQQYGDYIGTPLSQDISPWLRPRLTRNVKTGKGVVAAWPVRAKNQYRLSFADGYTLTMTMNNGQQTAPTFSLQKYFRAGYGDNMYNRPAIIPAATSSQLDDNGEERIHIAHMTPIEIIDVGDTPTECPLSFPQASFGTGGSSTIVFSALIDDPQGLLTGHIYEGNTLHVEWGDGTFSRYTVDLNGNLLNDPVPGSTIKYGPVSGEGSIYTLSMTKISCLKWSVPMGI